MLMSYLAILGRQPELSLAELESVLGSASVEPLGRHALLKTAPDLAKLGGTIKLARVIASGKALDDELIAEALAQLPHSDAKITLGLSYYGRRQDPLRLGMQLKKLIRADGRSVRLVLPKPGQGALSAAQLKFNDLVSNDSPELVILEQSNRAVIALTEQYQDIDAYTARDYARPGRDAKVGMLPPKLAQILVNLAGIPLGTILDPFCGSGVLLQEARLMGFEAIGSDSAPAMVKATKANMEWLDSKHAGLPSWSVEPGDARTIKISAKVAAIVSEGYLGPAFSHQPSPAQLDEAREDVSRLARAFLKNLNTQVKPGFIVVLCLPSWHIGPKTILPEVIDEIPRLGYTLRQFVATDAGELTYQRPGQMVGRKILVMRRT